MVTISNCFAKFSFSNGDQTVLKYVSLYCKYLSPLTLLIIRFPSPGIRKTRAIACFRFPKSYIGFLKN